MIRHGSLFSGIGGFDLAAQWLKWENVFQVENDSFCQDILNKHFKNTKKYTDIKDFTGHEYKNTIDVISGGFPCQSFSYAGKRNKKNDDRYLWPEMLKVIKNIKPTFIVAENVNGILSILDEICYSLEIEGYWVEPVSLSSCSLGFPHQRERIFIIAYSKCIRWKSLFNKQIRSFKKIKNTEWNWPEIKQKQKKSNELDTLGSYFLQFEKRFSEPAVFRNYDGLSKKLDIVKRLKAIGNAVSPQVVYEIFKIIDFLLKNGTRAGEVGNTNQHI